MKKLDIKEVFEIIDSINSEIVEFERVRPHNKSEIRRKDAMDKSAFKEMVSEAMEEGHQAGGDIELKIPSLNNTLIGHHDGIYWLE